MRDAPDLPSSFVRETSPRRRAVSFIAAVVANIAILLLLLTLSPAQIFRKPPGGSRMITYALPSDRPAPAKARAKSASKAAQPTRATAPPPPPRMPTPMPRPAEPTELTGLLPMTKEEIAQADIAKLPNHADERGGSGRASGTTEGDSDTSYTTGPGGEKLYNVAWYREPTDAELSTYITRPPPDSWGEIMCQTIERFHVDNCRELADSPSGSGIARGMRQAAWQFLVRPPRIGGRSILGTWVRIRISYSRRPRD